MYAVVGCSDCEHLWIVAGSPETTECRRCGARHAFRERRRLAEADDPDVARELRSRLLAERASGGTPPAADFGALEDRVADGVIEPVHTVETAQNDEVPTDRIGLVRHALETLEEPTRSAVVAHCRKRGLEAAAVERTLEGLRRDGSVTRTGDRYRLV